MCDIKASAKWYAKILRETAADRELSWMVNVLEKNELFAVTFDKRNVFCVMKTTRCQSKTEKNSTAPNF